MSLLAYRFTVYFLVTVENFVRISLVNKAKKNKKSSSSLLKTNIMLLYVFTSINRNPEIKVVLTVHFEEISRKMEETK